MGIETSSTAKIKQRHLKFMKVFKSNYKLESHANDDIFGNVNLYENINTGVVEVLEKILSYNNEAEIEKVTKTMEMRITKPHPNLIRVYNIEFID